MHSFKLSKEDLAGNLVKYRFKIQNIEFLSYKSTAVKIAQFVRQIGLARIYIFLKCLIWICVM